MNKIAVLIWGAKRCLIQNGFVVTVNLAKRTSGKMEKSCLFFRAQASWCKIVSNKRTVPSRTATSGWVGGLATITRWGTDVSEKIHQERYSRNN